MGSYCDGCEFCGDGGGTGVSCGGTRVSCGGTVVGCGSVFSDFWGLRTGGGFQRSYSDLTNKINKTKNYLPILLFQIYMCRIDIEIYSKATGNNL